MNPVRCPWAANAREIAYHDKEWGVPVTDDNALFEFLILENAQAGLSWDTILQRRQGYREAFASFNAETVAAFDEARIEHLLQDTRIIRNRRKVESAVHNARRFLEVQEEFDSFAHYLWGFVDGRPRVNRRRSVSEIPASDPLSEKLSNDLKKRGFRFIGPITCYAYIQATGLVNDHLVDCFRYAELVEYVGDRVFPAE